MKLTLGHWVRDGGLVTLLLSVPVLLTFGLFEWWPILQSLVISFQQTNLVDPAEWVGLDNFVAVLTDPVLPVAFGNTLTFVVMTVLIGCPIPLGVAVLIGELRSTSTRGAFSALAYVPVIIPPVVSVLLWKFFYDPSSTGLFNTVAGWVGMGPFPWLQDARSAMPSILLEAIWAGMGGATIIYLAALASIRSDLYEAAETDGAPAWRRLWHVTLPQLRPVILLLVLLNIVGGFQLFTEPFVFTGGGPENSTTTLLLLIYNYAFQYGDYGAATALSVLLALSLSAVSVVYLRATKAWSTS